MFMQNFEYYGIFESGYSFAHAHTKETLNESLPETEDPSSFPVNC